jgi:hypothetical protein
MMQYIQDKDVFKAVSFAAAMIKIGKPKGLSIYKAASYYNVATRDVAHYLGKRGADKSNMNRKNKESIASEY